MIKLEKLLKDEDAIRIMVNKENYQEFLIYMKENGCFWSNNCDINPEKDIYGGQAVLVRKNLEIHHPVGWISNMAVYNRKGFLFDDLKNNIIKEISRKS